MCDSDLEQYLLGYVTDESELAMIEEHLLICEQCIDRAQQLGMEMASIRHALVSDQKSAMQPIRRICLAMGV
jgi:predicted anti-sigma-YlaC factor YlaD